MTKKKNEDEAHAVTELDLNLKSLGKFWMMILLKSLLQNIYFDRVTFYSISEKCY